MKRKPTSQGRKLQQVPAIGSVLFVPGSRPERFGKALGAGADLVCIDLEDAVAPADKPAARAAAIAALEAAPADRLAVRINGLATLAGLGDLVALAEAGARPAFLFIPMVDGPGQIAIARGALGETAPPIVPIIETSAALRVAHEVAAAPGVAAMMFGGGDLSAELGVELAWEPLAAARAQFVLAAGGSGIGLIDVPYLAIDDPVGLAAETRHARALGFTGKAAIHPDQVDAIRTAFAPTPDEIAEARAALAAFAAAGGQVVRHRGRMIEAPVARRLQAMIAAQEARQDA